MSSTFFSTILLILSIFATGILLMPARTVLMAAVLVICIIASALIIIFRRRILLTGGTGNASAPPGSPVPASVASGRAGADNAGSSHSDSAGTVHSCFARIYLRALPFAIIAARMLMKLFYHTWLPSGQAAEIAGRFGLSIKTFLIIAAVVLGAFAAFFLTVIFSKIQSLLAARLGSRRWWDSVVKCFMILVITALQYVMLEYSAVTEVNALLGRNPLVTLVNFWVVLAFNLLVVLIAQLWRVSLIISTALLFIWSIADYYVVMFHGSPLFFSELVNFRTAAVMIGGYHFPIDENVVAILFFFAACMIFSIFYIRREKSIRPEATRGTADNGERPEAKRSASDKGEMTEAKRGAASTCERKKPAKCLIIRGAVRFAALVISVAILYLISGPIIRTDEAWRPWQISVSKLGFLMVMAEDVQDHMITVKMPDGYSAAALDEALRNAGVNPAGNGNAAGDSCAADYPDIILILNETFYDLNKYTDINSDVDYMADFYPRGGIRLRCHA